ncbi:hypothetical protein LTR97_002055 [Elasticomyces elasticus]|uniref:Uncharacterized protein n=1 Tax=Elasticomyces elasticus TaxID=574655 RepID=A0AAN7WAA8_9PEZI|nr:hypothetical protein LTR97_002055 [Elasticomyces elasticus]KAK5711112.1 hypothetical protein LTR15_012597 [Elasticomyces elasticus]
MGSRMYAFAGVGLAAVVGVLTSYATFAPELQRQQLERQGIFQDQHVKQEQQKQEHVISDAILSDLREAEAKLVGPSNKGALWGIREAIWGTKEAQNDTKIATAPSGQPKPLTNATAQQQAKVDATNG